MIRRTFVNIITKLGIYKLYSINKHQCVLSVYDEELIIICVTC